MKTSYARVILRLGAIGVAVWFSATAGSAADVSLYGLMKKFRNEQTDPGAPAPYGAVSYRFEAFVDPTMPGSVNSVTLTVPGGGMRTLTLGDQGEFGLEEHFSSAGAMDSVYGSGVYTFQISTVNDGQKTLPLDLLPATHPNPPHISNWLDAQAIDSTADFVLEWGAFADGTVDDVINVEVWDLEGNKVFETDLDGTGLAALIPAGVLSTGQAYGADVNLVRVTTADDTTYPGALGVAVYGTGTQLTLVTQLPGGLWSDAMDLGGGWKWREGFGYFSTNFEPWIYHLEHGWLYPFGTTTADLVVYDSAMGVFWWTSDSSYPYVYRFSDAAWLFYQIGSVNPRWFFNFSTAQWEGR